MIVTQQFPGPPPAPDVVKAGAENAGHRGEDQQQSEQRHQDQRHRVAVPDNVHYMLTRPSILGSDGMAKSDCSLSAI